MSILLLPYDKSNSIRRFQSPILATPGCPVPGTILWNKVADVSQGIRLIVAVQGT
jgi:hypothetical protein